MLFRDSEKMMTMNTWCAISSVFSCFRLRSSPLSSFFFFLCSALVFPPLFCSPLSVVPSLSRCLPSLFSLSRFFIRSPLFFHLSVFCFLCIFKSFSLPLFSLCFLHFSTRVPLFCSVSPLAFIARECMRYCMNLVTTDVH